MTPVVIAISSAAVACILYKIVSPETVRRSLFLSLIEATILLTMCLVLPAIMLSLMHDPIERTYPDGAFWSVLLSTGGSLAGWHLVRHRFQSKQIKHLRLRLIAGISAFSVLFVALLGPIAAIRLISGVPLDAKGSDWEGYVLVMGGSVGAAAAFLTFSKILKIGGHFDDDEIWSIWRGGEDV